MRADRLRARFGAGVLIVAALAIGGLIKNGAPDTDTSERPFTRAGAIGKPVDARTFDATVLGVRGAAKIRRDSGILSHRDHDTGGVWILVKVRVVAHDESLILGWAGVKDGRGRTYDLTDRIDQPLIGGGRSLQPGIPLTGEVAFEVPRAVATDLVVQITERPIDRRMSAMVEVRLPITKADVDGWLATPAAVALDSPVIG